MNGAFVGTWSLAQHCPDTLQYDLGWAQSEQGRPLSLSLPFTPGNAPHCGDTVHAFFKKLLPDSRDIRERMARRYKTGTTDAFDLLAEVGRDCAGALEILPMGTSSAGVLPLQAHTLTDAQVAEVLRGTTTPSTLGLIENEDDFRICIAGAQELTALLQVDGQWCLPRGATPTTHIFKLPMGLIGGMKLDMTLSVENEWLCAVVLKAFGLPVAACRPRQFEDMKGWSSTALTGLGGPAPKMTSDSFVCPRKTYARPRVCPRTPSTKPMAALASTASSKCWRAPSPASRTAEPSPGWPCRCGPRTRTGRCATFFVGIGWPSGRGTG